jgi:hypothetical protein
MTTRRTPKQTAIILAVILRRSGLTRARVSTKTVRIASKRSMLRTAFVSELLKIMANDFDWIVWELSTGGYGAVQAKTLEAAKSVTMKRGLTDEERKALRRGTIDFDALEEEAIPEEDAADDGDGDGDSDG